MTVLLLSGEGPSFKYWDDLSGSLFDVGAAAADGLGGIDLREMVYQGGNGSTGRLLRRKKGRVAYLVTYVLEAILYANDIDFVSVPLRDVWADATPPSDVDPEAVLLSTTFICNYPTLRRAIGWIERHYPGVPLVVGGQFSNLKYAQVLSTWPSVSYVVRGDGEDAIPAVLEAIRGRRTVQSVPNLVHRSDGTPKPNRIRYVDLDAAPAPWFPGGPKSVPYESMRGCPFTCRFCSYPAASPTWRYKSAQKIYRDWIGYAQASDGVHIQSLDSTFTVPKPRLAELLPMLVDAPLTWEAYTRANAIHSAAVADALEAAHCVKLSIGFESMSPETLRYMHKQVRAEQNRAAHTILRDRGIQYRISYMVGYPGETPENYRATHDFILDEFVGYFMLNVFSFTDETMPVWEDAERFGLEVADVDDPDAQWRHRGMAVDTARELRAETIRGARWHNEHAVWLLWQAEYETPLVPGSTRTAALRQEKLVERLAMLPVDVASPTERSRRSETILAELRQHGIEAHPPGSHGTRAEERIAHALQP